MAKFFTAQSAAGMKVDFDARRINGAAFGTIGPANSDTFDAQTLAMLAALGNGGGVRARFDHPNRANPGEIEQTLENLLGEWLNFRVDADICRADCQMAGVNVELEDKVLKLADKTPHLFGISAVFDDAPPPKGQKPKPGQPCRPTKLYSGDFVDLPAANRAGLFAATAAESKTMDLDMYAKDGKLFCQVDGKEYALKHNAETYAATKAMMKAAKDPEDEDDDSPETEAAKKKAAERQTQTQEQTTVSDKPLTPADIEKAKTDAIAAERTRRKSFSTILATAGVTRKEDVEELENFYEQGLDEKQLKFLASRTIGARAKPLGEGSGAHESQHKEADEATKVADDAGKRFDENPSLRKQFGVRSADTASDEYKTGRGRYVASARNRFLKEKEKS